jgi:hypothetical protein
VQEMRARLPAFAIEYSRRHEHPILVTDLSFVFATEGLPAIGDDLFGPRAVRVISRISLEREVTDRIWNSCEPLLRRKHPDADSWRFVRALFARRESSTKTIARRHLTAWKETEPELYAAYELKEDFLNIWQPEAGASVEGQLDAWMRRIVQHPVLHLDALVATIAMHREQMLAFSRYDFLARLYERFPEITSLDKSRTGRSFATARVALLARGLAQQNEKLSNLVGQFADILKG